MLYKGRWKEFFVCSAGDGIQGLQHARQVLLQMLSYTPNPDNLLHNELIPIVCKGLKPIMCKELQFNKEV